MKTFGRRTLAAVLSVIIVLSCFAGLTFSVGAETSGDYEYEVLDNGTVRIIGYYGSDTDVVIPSEIDGKKVTSIVAAFENCNSIVSVTIPDGVEELGWHAFAFCKNLENVTMPDSVKDMGFSVFEGCAFKEITISNGIRALPYVGFAYCRNLEIVNLPKNLKSLGQWTFAGCDSLREVNISENLKYLGIDAFVDCSSLNRFNVSEKNNTFTSVDGVIFSKDMKELLLYPMGKEDIEYTIPESIEVIRGYSDYWYLYSINLKKLVIPKSVTEIQGRHIIGYNGYNEKKEDLIIVGYSKTAAEKYAKDNGFEFIDISSCKHTETELENRKEATCTEVGYSGDEHCKNCTMLIKNGAEIPALGHSEETIKGKPATCTEKGLTDEIKCSVCGEIIKAQEEIPAVGHTFDKGVCTACGAIDPDYKVVLNSLNEQIKVDNESKSVSMAPAKTSGMKVSEFKKQFDGEISVDIDDNSLVANGTKFKFGGNEFTVIVKGDVQADGKITASDARMVLRIAARLESVDANAFGAADINGDGKVSPGEARKVLRFVARLENTIA